jgi:hypothetical protein
MGKFNRFSFKSINVFEIIGITVSAIALVGFFALLGGTIIFWFWPHVIPVVFPGAVAAGTIVAKLAWGKAVLFTWMCGILFKGSGSTSSS